MIVGLVLTVIVAFLFWWQNSRDSGAASGSDPTELDRDHNPDSSRVLFGRTSGPKPKPKNCPLKVVALLADEETPNHGKLCVSRADGEVPVGYPNCREFESGQIESVALPRSTNSMVWVDFPGFMATPRSVSTFVFSPGKAQACDRSVTFRLEPGSITTGIVRDSVGGVVEGALILSSAGFTTSDDEGRATHLKPNPLSNSPPIQISPNIG